MSSAFLRFPSERSAIFSENCFGKLIFSILAVFSSTATISSFDGDGILMHKQRLRIGASTLLVLYKGKINEKMLLTVANSTKRQVRTYFSIVLLNACCASLVNMSTSFKT